MESVCRLSSVRYEPRRTGWSFAPLLRGFESSANIPLAIPGTAGDCENAKFRTDIHPIQLLGWRFELPFEVKARAPDPLRRRLKEHWCPKSNPVLGFDLFEFLFDDAVDFGGILAQMPKLTESLHPRFFRSLCSSDQLVLDRLRDVLPERNSSLRCR
jgi:hypothetical protein